MIARYKGSHFNCTCNPSSIVSSVAKQSHWRGYDTKKFTGNRRDGRGFPDKIKWRCARQRSVGDAYIPGARWLHNATRHFIIISFSTATNYRQWLQRDFATTSTQIKFSFFSFEVEMMQCSVFHHLLSLRTEITKSPQDLCLWFPHIWREAHVSWVHYWPSHNVRFLYLTAAGMKMIAFW